jgi:hypothetical protein
MKFSAIALMMLFGIFCSCDINNECQGFVEGPDYMVTANTKSYIDNYIDVSKIIFLDLASEEEVEFVIADLDQGFLNYSGIGPCPDNPRVTANINGNSESIKLAFSNADLEESIIYSLTEFPSIVSAIGTEAEDAWEILIQYGNIEDSPLTSEPVMVLELDRMAFNTVTESQVIGGKTFNDVIEINESNPGFDLPSNPSLEVKITRAEGVIYINDIINERELVYLRVE